MTRVVSDPQLASFTAVLKEIAKRLGTGTLLVVVRRRRIVDVFLTRRQHYSASDSFSVNQFLDEQADAMPDISVDDRLAFYGVLHALAEHVEDGEFKMNASHGRVCDLERPVRFPAGDFTASQ